MRRLCRRMVYGNEKRHKEAFEDYITPPRIFIGRLVLVVIVDYNGCKEDVPQIPPMPGVVIER